MTLYEPELDWRHFFVSDQPDDLRCATLLPPLVRRQCRDRERMNFVANERAKALVDQLVPGEQTLPVEFRSDNESSKMGVIVALHFYNRIAESGFD
jgi:hypothetical protein